MLIRAVESYLVLRRAAGFAFRSEGSLLRSFGAFSKASGESHVGVPVAIQWAGLGSSVPQRARRLGVVIRFARHIHAEDQQHEIPPPVFGVERRTARRIPSSMSRGYK